MPVPFLEFILAKPGEPVQPIQRGPVPFLEFILATPGGPVLPASAELAPFLEFILAKPGGARPRLLHLPRYPLVPLSQRETL